MKKNKTILFLFGILFISFIFSVSAQPPFEQTQISDSGFILQVNSVEILKQNNPYTFGLHVFNNTNGVPIYDPTLTCNLEAYDPSGEYLFEGSIPYDDGNEWMITLNENNFTNTGNIYFLFACNSSNQGGELGYFPQVTKTGSNTLDTIPNLLLGLIIIFFLVASFFLYLNTLVSELGFKIFFLIAGFIFLLGGLITSSIVATNSNVPEEISSTTSVLVFSTSMIFFVFIAYILINQTKNALEYLSGKKGYESY